MKPGTLFSPKRCLEKLLAQTAREHEKEHLDKPFQRPGFPKLAALLEEAGYLTPRGHSHWWPAQVQKRLEGHFEKYYGRYKDRGIVGVEEQMT